MQTKKTFVVLAARWYKDRILVLVKGLVLVQYLRCRRDLSGCAGGHIGRPHPQHEGFDLRLPTLVSLQGWVWPSIPLIPPGVTTIPASLNITASGKLLLPPLQRTQGWGSLGTICNLP